MTDLVLELVRSLLAQGCFGRCTARDQLSCGLQHPLADACHCPTGFLRLLQALCSVQAAIAMSCRALVRTMAHRASRWLSTAGPKNPSSEFVLQV
jgi:hypothetical protein